MQRLEAITNGDANRSSIADLVFIARPLEEAVKGRLLEEVVVSRIGRDRDKKSLPAAKKAARGDDTPTPKKRKGGLFAKWSRSPKESTE